MSLSPHEKNNKHMPLKDQNQEWRGVGSVILLIKAPQLWADNLEEMGCRTIIKRGLSNKTRHVSINYAG